MHHLQLILLRQNKNNFLWKLLDLWYHYFAINDIDFPMLLLDLVAWTKSSKTKRSSVWNKIQKYTKSTQTWTHVPCQGYLLVFSHAGMTQIIIPLSLNCKADQKCVLLSHRDLHMTPQQILTSSFWSSTKPQESPSRCLRFDKYHTHKNETDRHRTKWPSSFALSCLTISVSHSLLTDASTVKQFTPHLFHVIIKYSSCSSGLASLDRSDIRAAGGKAACH